MIMCPIAHVPHPPRYPISIFNNIYDTPLPMSHCPCVQERCQVVKKMSSCQKDVKCQKVKHMDYGGGSPKKMNSHNEVHTY